MQIRRHVLYVLYASLNVQRMYYCACVCVCRLACNVHLCVLFTQSKQKKIREKYGDQDEVDREVMMSLLAVRYLMLMI